MWSSLAAAAIAFTLSALLVAQLERQDAGAVLGLEAVYREYLGGTRMILGAILVLAWPATLHLSARLLRLQFRRPGAFLTFLGVLLGAFAYCLSFLPWPALASALLLPPAAALALYVFVLRLSAKQATLLWFVQGSFTLAAAAGSLWGLESAAAGTALNPIQELPAIYHAARQLPGNGATVHLHSDSQSYILVWDSSGSEWLDRRANRVQAHINAPSFANEWYIEIEVDRKTYATSRGNGDLASTPVFVPRPDTGYRVKLLPAPERGTGAQVVSLLPLKDSGSRPENQATGADGG